jgi:alpha-N-acetylglucosaminidase
LDYIASAGYNEALELIGQDYVWYTFLQKAGYTEAQAREWISLPGHQPWQWMGNITGYHAPISQSLLEKRLVLGREIVSLMKARGIAPVFPGFSGTVPADFDQHVAGTRLIPQGKWGGGYARPPWIDPTSPGFNDAAKLWYAAQDEAFGATSAYAMDILHEGGQAGGVDIPSAYEAVQSALLSSHPQAVWMMQGWTENPKRGFADRLDKSKVLILELSSDDDAKYLAADWDGVSWTYGSINNWGGRGYVFGRLQSIAYQMPLALASGMGASMTGIASVMEDVQTNDADADLLADMAWRTEPVNLTNWLGEYGVRRYQFDSPNVRAAWAAFARSSYSLTDNTDYKGNGGPDAMWEVQPGWNSTDTVPARPDQLYWDPAVYDSGWRRLLAVQKELQKNEAYNKDLVDFGMQLLSDRSRQDLVTAKSVAAKPVGPSYSVEQKVADFSAAAESFMSHLMLADELGNTHQDSMLGALVNETHRWAATPEEAQSLEYDLRTLVSTWGDPGGGLRNYSARHIGGLLGTLYRQRWDAFFQAQLRGIESSSAPEKVDFGAIETQWVNSTDLTDIPTTQEGNTIAVSKRIAHAVQPLNLTNGQEISLSTSEGTARQGGPFTVTLSITNTQNFALTGLLPLLELPDGWTIRSGGVPSVSRVSPGGAATVTWSVLPSRHTPLGSASMTARLQWLPSNGVSNPNFVGTPTVFASKDVTVEPWVATAGIDFPFPSIHHAYTDVGITKDDNTSVGSFDFSGNSFSEGALEAAGLTAGEPVSALGTTFDMPNAGVKDVVASNGAWFKVNPEERRGSKLGFLGGYVGPRGAGSVTVVYADGTTSSGLLGFPNWAGTPASSPAYGASVVADSRYRNGPSGQMNQGLHYVVYGNTIDIDPNKTVASIKVPLTADGAIRVFAASVIGD